VPRFHDPELRSPERIRAVVALLWLGFFQLLYALVCVFAVLIAWMLHDDMGGFDPIDYLEESIILFILVLPTAIAGGMAVAGAVTVCKRGLLGRARGSVAIGISAIYFALIWFFVPFVIYDYIFPDSAVSSYPALVFFPLLFYACVGSILTVLAAHRCWRRHTTEPGPRPPMRWGKKNDATSTRGYIDTITGDAHKASRE